MVELACAADPRFVASRIEEGSEKSYSIHTIDRVKAASGAANGATFFIIGSDAFAEIQTWYRWEEVIRAVEFIVVARPGHEIAAPPGARVHRLETLELLVSSSDIRDALARGETPSDLPRAVAGYIRDHGLYGSSQASPASGPGL